MSGRNSSRKAKTCVGNGTYPPHMQSSLSPQGFGLYNSGLDDSTGTIASGLSPLKQQQQPILKDYLLSPNPPQNGVVAAAGDGHWNATGNENFATFPASNGSRPNGVGENGAMWGFGGSFPQPQQQQLPQQQCVLPPPPIQFQQSLPSYQTYSARDAPHHLSPNDGMIPPSATIKAAGALAQNESRFRAQSSITPSKSPSKFNRPSDFGTNLGNHWVMPSMYPGENPHESPLQHITPPPPPPFLSRKDGSGGGGGGDGSVNGSIAPLVKTQLQPYQNNTTTTIGGSSSGGGGRSGDRELNRDRQKDRLIDSLSNSDMITCLPGFKKRSIQPQLRPIWQQNLGEDRFSDKVAHQRARQDMSYRVNSSGPLSTLRGPTVSSAYSRGSPGSMSPALGSGDNSASRSPLSYNRTTGFYNQSRPPSSPVSRARAAIGKAQSELTKLNTFTEAEEDRRRVPGSWKNMGTPFSTEPMTKSAQKQQKAQYRLDLERQILASKMRKAEEERKDRDNSDHPLGPEYAHPALTYYNPPHKLVDHGGCSPPTAPEAAAALTKYIKEKYSLDVRGGGGGTTTPPVDTGGSTTAAGRIAPIQQAKKEKALANLMKSRMHPRDQNQSNGSRHIPPPNQLQTGGGKAQAHNGMMMMMQPGNGSRFPQQQQQQQQPQQQYGQGNLSKAQQPTGFPCAYPPGTYPSRTTAYGMPAAPGWPYVYPAYSPFAPYGIVNPYGQPQPVYPSANRRAINPQQTGQPHQENYSHSQPLAGQPQLQQVLREPQNYQQNSQPQAYQQQQQQQQNYWQEAQGHPHLQEDTRPGVSRRSKDLYDHEDNVLDGRDANDNDDEDGLDFEELKERTCTTQKIWQTSDELPDPELRTAIYKAELRKQIDADRRRKAERLAREKEEEDRIERKIKEFHDEERRRIAIEQKTRAELEGHRRNKAEQRQKRNEALAMVRVPIPREYQERDIRPRSRSSLLAAKLARYGPEAGDFEGFDETETFNHDDYIEECEEKFSPPSLASTITGSIHPLRRGSPPVPVVQKKIIEGLVIASHGSRNGNIRRQMSCDGQNFLMELKTKLSSERDLVERRLREKLESTQKNMNLLKYTMNRK